MLRAELRQEFCKRLACKGISSDENCDVVRRGAVRSPAGIGSPASFARKHAAATAIEALDEARHGPRRASSSWRANHSVKGNADPTS